MDTKRHRLQMAAVVLTGSATIAAAVAARRSVALRQYRPALFGANHLPPQFNFIHDAMRAMVNATLLAGGAFSFGIASTCWIMDVDSLEAFGRRMAHLLGAEKAKAELQALASQSNAGVSDDEVANALNKWFNKK